MRPVKLHHMIVIATVTLLLVPRSQGALIGFWNFDQMSGTTALDTSGSGINGTLSASNSGFDPGAGLSGGGAVNLSTGGYVNMGNHYSFSGTQSFTLQEWVDTTDTSPAVLLSRTYSENQDGYFLAMNNVDPGCTGPSYENAATAGVGNGNIGCTLFTPPSSKIVDNGQWHQIVATYGGGTASLYVDGVFQSSVTGVNIDSCPTADFLIGGVDFGVSGPGGTSVCGVGTPLGVFSGLVTDVAVWNDTLNSSQIALLYQNPNNAFVAESPEPASFGLLGVGFSGVLALRLAFARQNLR